VAPVTARDAARLRAEVLHELGNLSRALDDIRVRKDARDETTTYAVALLLMNYYTGAEHLFRHVALHFGGVPPGGDRWHQQLLEDMALDIEGVRPPVLSAGTCEAMGRLMRFRHVVRNLYAWTLRRADIDVLLGEIDATHAALVADLHGFSEFLASLASG
jgi:hypothetical protein